MLNGQKSAQNIIRHMVQKIVSSMAPEKIILFGSHARGTATPDSDVDLLVVFPRVVSRRHQAVKIYKLLAGMGLSKDILVVTSEELEKYKDVPGTMIYPALKEGKVLYEH